MQSTPFYIFWLIGGMAIFAGGCKSQAPVPPPSCYSHYLAPSFLSDSGPRIRRVVLLPMGNQSEFPQAALAFQEALAAELRTVGLFEVVSLPPTGVPSELRSVQSVGQFQEEVLIAIARNHHADAVIFSSLTDYQPYWPPRLGVSLHLVSMHETVTLASIDGLWDAKNAEVALAAEDFYTSLSAKSTVHRTETILFAPSYFQKFVAHQVVQALVPPPALILPAETTMVAPAIHPSMVEFAGDPSAQFTAPALTAPMTSPYFAPMHVPPVPTATQPLPQQPMAPGLPQYGP